MSDEQLNKQSSSILNNLGPKKSFVVGLLAAIFFTAVVGVIVLGILLIKNTSSTSTGSSKTYTGTTNTNSSATNTSTQISIQPVTSDDHVRGELNRASVVIVEFSDTECPFCKNFHSTMQQVVNDYGDQVAWVYRHFPLDSLHAKARKEAEATECAAEQGGNEGFWNYIDRLFEITPSNDGLLASQLPQIAEEVGLNGDKLQTCLDSGKYADQVDTHYQDAVASGGKGTPYSVVITEDGTTVPLSGAQPISAVKSLIDGLL